MIKESNFMIKLVSNHNMVCWMDQSITRGVHQINKLQCTMQQPSAIVGSDSPSSFPEVKINTLRLRPWSQAALLQLSARTPLTYYLVVRYF